MERFDGDRRAASAVLGIGLKTLYNKLDRYGLRPGSATRDRRVASGSAPRRPSSPVSGPTPRSSTRRP